MNIEPSPPQAVRARRRARALLRDEARLRRALADHEARRFDLNTVALVRTRTDELIETLSAIVRDDTFWHSLGQGEPLAPDHAAALRRFDPVAFETLLIAAGYQSPPRPPAHELVDDTLRELEHALQQGWSTASRREAGRRARAGLQTTILRIRRQISATETSSAHPGVLRSAARATLIAARWTIPKAVAVLAGLGVESLVPGTGLGHIVGTAGGKVLGTGVEQATERLLDQLSVPDDEERPVPAPDLPSIPEVLTAHVAAAADRVLAAMAVAGPTSPSPSRLSDDSGRAELLVAQRHVERIGELCVDHGLVLTPALAETLQEIRVGLTGITAPESRVYGSSGLEDLLVAAAERLRDVAAPLHEPVNGVFGADA